MLFFLATPKPVAWIPGIERKQVVIEAERFIDARNFACRFLGVAEVNIEKVPEEFSSDPRPRWEIRLNGTAMNGKTVYMECREILDWTDVKKAPWRSVREL
jgi:hypothetical protein